MVIKPPLFDIKLPTTPRAVDYHITLWNPSLKRLYTSSPLCRVTFKYQPSHLQLAYNHVPHSCCTSTTSASVFWLPIYVESCILFIRIVVSHIFLRTLCQHYVMVNSVIEMLLQIQQSVCFRVWFPFGINFARNPKNVLKNVTYCT